MGRPINRQLFFGNNSANHYIIASVWGTNDSGPTTGYITRQKGTNKFLATTVNGTSIVYLVNTAPAAKGQATITCSPVVGGGTKYVKRITSKRVITFDGLSFHWLVTGASAPTNTKFVYATLNTH
jgi:hypothetical protein